MKLIITRKCIALVNTRKGWCLGIGSEQAAREAVS
jgi:hypothetical protein